MKLDMLIDCLTAIRQRLPTRDIEVEVRDPEGYPLSDFVVTTEFILNNGRTTVRFTPRDEQDSQ